MKIFISHFVPLSHTCSCQKVVKGCKKAHGYAVNKGLKIRWWKHRTGSSPVVPMASKPHNHAAFLCAFYVENWLSFCRKIDELILLGHNLGHNFNKHWFYWMKIVVWCCVVFFRHLTDWDVISLCESFFNSYFLMVFWMYITTFWSYWLKLCQS